MAAFDMKKLSTGDRVITGAGVVALISIFLPWEGFSAGPLSVSESGFSSGFGWLGALLIIGAAVYLLMLRSGSNVPNFSYGPAVIILGASLLGTLIVILRWLTLPSGGSGVGGYSWGPSIGIYLTLIAGIAQALFALKMFRSSGEAAPWAAKPTGDKPEGP